MRLGINHFKKKIKWLPYDELKIAKYIEEGDSFSHVLHKKNRNMKEKRRYFFSKKLKSAQ